MTESKSYKGIMVSSTYTDMQGHREDINDAIQKLGFKPVSMEYSGANAKTDIIDTSLQMVSDSVAYIGILSHKYGQIPNCSKRNPDALSITELEFKKAVELGKPILLFIIGDEHPIKISDVEKDPVSERKLKNFKQNAKKMHEGSDVERIYEVFESREELAQQAVIALGRLAQYLAKDSEDDNEEKTTENTPPISELSKTNSPPNLRAIPRYLASQKFIGRSAEINILNDWCAEADQNPMLLFEAIGGSGKSMLTWTWLNNHANQTRHDWAGRFWFSFYEGGATMTKFCREALAYMTGQQSKAFKDQKMPELVPQLLEQLESKPWLLVLDGLERILVAYHRLDAPRLMDSDVDMALDQISDRDPRTTINPEDEELLQRLTAVAPSKILITSRLLPQALVNQASRPRYGVRSEILKGLRPTEAEKMFRYCGIEGSSANIQNYLQRNCDGHPLVIGALAGLVNDYLPDRGNFDAWLEDPEAGGKLTLIDLDLIQSQNHILAKAIDALETPALKLLQTMAILQESTNYVTLKKLYDAQKILIKQLTFIPNNLPDEELIGIDKAIIQLESRGLIQYEHGTKLYELHPVVKGITTGKMGEKDTGEIGAVVVDYFTSRQPITFKNAESIEDLAGSIQIVSTLTQMGDFDRAFYVLSEIESVLYHKFSAHEELQRLVKPFFPNGWNKDPILNDISQQREIFDTAGMALYRTNPKIALEFDKKCVSVGLELGQSEYISSGLKNLCVTLNEQRKLAQEYRLQTLGSMVASVCYDQLFKFDSDLQLYSIECKRGQGKLANKIWQRLDPINDYRDQFSHLEGEARFFFAENLFFEGTLGETTLKEAETLCSSCGSQINIINCLSLRAEWHLARNESEKAISPLLTAIIQNRKSSINAPKIEALLLLAKHRIGDLLESDSVIAKFHNEYDHETTLPLAQLWHEMGETDRAIETALKCHKSACADGEPFTYKYYVDQSEALLRKLGQTPPPVPKYDPEKEEKFEWEDDVLKFIEEEKAKREQQTH